MAYLKDIIRKKSTNLPVDDGTEVEIRLVATNALLATVTTTNGFFEWQVDGYPGAVYYQCNASGATKVHSSLSVGPAGPFQLGELTDQMNFFVGGRIRGLAGEMLVTPKVSGLSVSVATGAMTSKGMLYRLYTAKDLTFAPGPPDNAVTNTYGIFVVFYGRASAEPGKTEIVVSNVAIGNEAALGTDVWRVELCRVTIAPGQTSLTVGNISLTSGYSDKHIHDPVDITNIDQYIITLLRVALADYRTGVIGAFRNGLAVTQVSTSLNITTNTGGAILNRADTSIMVDHALAPDVIAIPVTSASPLKRIDTIVLEIAPATGYKLITTPVFVRVAGTPAATPVAPVLQQDATKWQIPLADVTVTHAAISSVVDLRAASTSGSAAVAWAETNFAATGVLSSGQRTLGIAKFTLPAGQWFIRSQCNFTARNNVNNGTFTMKLTGNGTPIAPDESTRIFQTVGGVPRTILITGRRNLTLAAPTEILVNAIVVFATYDETDMRDGTVFFEAHRVA